MSRSVMEVLPAVGEVSFDLGGQVTPEAETGDPAVRVDIQADAADLGGCEAKAVAGVRLEAGTRQERCGGAVLVDAGEGELGGGVELQVGGVDLSEADDAGSGKGDQGPVVGGVPAAGGLPAFGLVAGQAGEQHVVGGRIEHVGAFGDAGTVLQSGKVDGETDQVGGVRDDLTVDAEPRNATVGEHVQPDVGGQAAGVDGEDVGGAPLEGRSGDDLGPVGGGEVGHGRVAVHGAGVHGRMGGKVALEPGRVDDDAVDDAGQAEADE